MKRWIIALYALLLKMYPAQFRDMFADEMLAVFTLAYDANRQERLLSQVGFLLREFTALPLAITDEHLQALEKKGIVMTLATPQSRRIIRISSLLYTGLVYLVILTIPEIRGNSLYILPFAVFQIIMLVSILLAWRWPKMGGIVILTSATLLGLIMFLGMGFAGNLLGALLAAGLWSLPYLAWGILFILSRPRHTDSLQPAI